MLYKEVTAVCAKIHRKHLNHLNTLCGRMWNFLMLKLDVHIVTTGI